MNCLIFGGSSGIGLAAARRLKSRGDHPILCARGDDRLRAAADELDAPAIQGDATSFDDAARVISQAGELDAIVCCVGSILLKPAHLTTPDEFEHTMAQNITAAFGVVRAGAPALKGRENASIVLMSSCAASTGLTNHEAISAAKGAVEGLTRSAAATYAPSRVRVNAVAPGLVDTPMASKLTGNDAALKASTAMHPLGRIGAPEEVASLIAWLVSAEASWVTGQVIGIDGGLARVRGR